MLNTEMIESFLKKIDRDFPVPLSEKTDLHQLSCKFIEKATICYEYQGNDIISMIAGYTENVVNNQAYISVVATIPKARGRGFIKKLMKDFISICTKKNLDSIHLYTARQNRAAINLYLALGFKEYVLYNEQRVNDLHLIYYIKGSNENAQN